MAIDFARDLFIPLGQAGAEAFDDTSRWVDPNNRRFSDRLWRAKQFDRDQIDAILRGAVASGDDPLKAAKRLEDYLTPVGQKTTTRTPRSGMGNYAARRLARTEVSRAFERAGLQASELNPFVDRRKRNLSGAHKRADECDRLARGSSRGQEPGIYFLSDYPPPPSHPHCVCYGSPVTTDDTDAVVAQLRRDIGLETGPFAPKRSSIWDNVVTLFRVARQFVTREAA